GGGSLTPGGAATNAAGMATATRVLGTVPGATADTAKAAGLSGSPVVFTVTTNPGNAVTLAKQGGDSATDTVAATLPTPYTVRVADRLNNPVPGVSVTWAATGGGSITPTSLSNGSGVASATRVLGTVAGSQGASATVSGLSGSPVAFSAVALHGAAKNLAKQGGDAQNTTVDSLVTPLPAVLVTDQFGNPVPGVGVTFALGAGGARNGAITGTTPTTDAAGVATLGSWRLGSTAGPDTVTAASAGLTGSPLTFIDFGNSGSAAIMSLAGGDAQTDTVGATLAAYSVKVTDGALNPVSGVTVSWSASGGGSITPSSITNASGIATATRVLGTTAGAQGAQATVGGLSGSPVTFSATANHGMPVLLAKSAGDGLSATVNTATATPPAVAVTDQFGNPVAGVSITFAVPVGHGSVTGASTSTAANGVAQAGSWVLDSAAGANSLSATAGISLSGNPAGFSATGVHDALSPARSTVAATTASITACQSSCSPGTTATTITVTALDQYGNAIAGAAVRDSGNPVTGNNATATGTTDGTGTFSATFFSTKAEAKTVAARIGGVAITPTAAVTVNPDLTQLLANSTVTASSPITASTGSSPSTVTVTVKDQFGNGVSGRTVTVGVSGGGNTVTQPALTTDAVGAATGSFSSTLAQVKSVTASVSGTGGGAIVASAGVTVNPAAAAKVVMVTQPANWTSGTTSGSTQPSVRLQDAFSNNVLQSGVTVSAFVSSGSGTLSGTTSALTNASGVATYSNLSITGPLTGYGSHAFTFSSSGLTSATSSVITVLVSHAYNIQGGIYTPVCNTCHVWTYASTVNQASSCASTPVLITPSSTAASHIYRKVAGTQACGGFMPPSGVNAVYSDIIGRWINQGAPNN
ncbi:MAG TPA: Ig-like domain-containing protein, partial [Gemmatimonadales bacterium]